MKDLYTFDWNETQALETYESVKRAYSAFFDDLRLPNLVAEATSGNIGGNMSHEFHVMSSKGEDDVVSCDTCDYVANEEVAKRDDGFPNNTVKVSIDQMKSMMQAVDPIYPEKLRLRRYFALTQNGGDILQIIVPAREGNSKGTAFNPHVIKELYPNIDLNIGYTSEFDKSSVSDTSSSVGNVKNPYTICIIDRKISCEGFNPTHVTINGHSYPAKVIRPGLDLAKIVEGDNCPKSNCSGHLKIQKCVEIAHTFYLGTRYSAPLNATISVPAAVPPVNNPLAESDQPSHQAQLGHMSTKLPIQMGCHGIGISRLIATAANVLKDAKGLNWPRAIAPFEAVIVPTLDHENGASQVHDLLKEGDSPVDCVIDDRSTPFASKMKDADLIGYPVIVVVGKGWKEEPRECQVQCRRLKSLVLDVSVKELKGKIGELLAQL